MLIARGIAWAVGGALNSAEDLPGDLPFDVGEAEIPPCVTVGESLMVHSEKMQDRGMKVVNAELVFRGVIAVFIGSPVAHAAAHPRPRHPDSEALRVVVPTVF